MLKLFAIIASLHTGAVFTHEYEGANASDFTATYEGRAACLAQAEESRPALIQFLYLTQGAVVDKDYTLSFKCEPDGKPA